MKVMRDSLKSVPKLTEHGVRPDSRFDCCRLLIPPSHPPTIIPSPCASYSVNLASRIRWARFIQHLSLAFRILCAQQDDTMVPVRSWALAKVFTKQDNVCDLGLWSGDHRKTSLEEKVVCMLTIIWRTCVTRPPAVLHPPRGSFNMSSRRDSTT